MLLSCITWVLCRRGDEMSVRWSQTDSILDGDAEMLTVPALEKEFPWFAALTTKSVAALILLFGLFLGGRYQPAQLSVILLISLWLLFFAGSRLIRRPGSLFSWGKLARTLLVPAALFFAIGAVEQLPLPLYLVRLISPKMASLYQAAGSSSSAYFSLNVWDTRMALWWSAALAVVFFVVAGLPRKTVSFEAIDERSSKTLSSSFERSLQIDLVVNALQRSLIAAGIFFSLIAISHWALRIDLLFGLFGAERTGAVSERAHWPFVNPNHLAIVLEIALMAALSRYLRSLQISSMKAIRGRTVVSTLRMLKDPERLGRRVRGLLLLLLLLIGCFLTMSRAGICLTGVGVLILWRIYSLYPASPRNEGAKVSQSGRGSLRYWRIFERVRVPAMVVVGVLTALIFIGESGRDLLTKRVEYGLTASYDESRSELTRAALSVWREFPVAGVGLGCWALAAASHITPQLAGWMLDYAHNDYAQYLAETGILGFSVLLISCVLIARGTLRVWRSPILPVERTELAGAFVTCLLPLLHALVEFPFHIPALALAIFVALAIYVRVVDKLDNAIAA